MSAASLLSVPTSAFALTGDAMAPTSDAADATAFAALVDEAVDVARRDSAGDPVVAAAAVAPPPVPAPPTTPLAETGKGAAEDTARPQVLPGVAFKADPTAPQVLPGAADVAGKIDPTLPQVLPGARGKEDGAAPQVLPAGAGPAAGAADVPTPSPAVVPPPRPPVGAIADRTSPRPDDGEGKRNAAAAKLDRGPQILPGDVGPDEPAVEPVGRNPQQGAGQFDLAAGQGAGQAGPTAAAAPARPAAPAPIADAAPAPAATPAEPAATTDPVAAARETLHFGLSRVAVEATAQIAAQIVKRLEGRTTRFEMALTPDDLGRVDVSLDIDADGALAARLAFDNPAAAAELRGRVDELRRQLEDAGFRLAEDALQFAERDPSSGGRGFGRDRDTAFARAGRVNAGADDAVAAAPAGRWISLSLTPDRVDLKV